VDCRISVTDSETQRVVRLAGRLGGAQVPDLLQICGERGAREVIIDLADLLNADAVGIDALRRLQQQGATLARVNPYVQLKLESGAR
jgi:hypothetical protein